MVGVTSYGIYIPYYRLSREGMREAWELPTYYPGEKAIVNYDEDSLTMACESIFDCVSRVDEVAVDGLHLATTSYPSSEKQGATMVATIADLPEEIFTMDFSKSLRAGAGALKSALDAVGSGSAKEVMVSATDCRLGNPGTDLELIVGDGSASLLVGGSGVIAALVGHFSISDNFTDFLRKEGESCVRRMDDLRLINTFGYRKIVSRCVEGILQRYGFEAKDMAKFICPSNEPPVFARLAKQLGFDQSQLQDPLYDQIGHTGAAHPLLMLAAALDEAEEGDKILMVAYGDGAESFIFEVTSEINKVKKRGEVKEKISSGKLFTNYPRYLHVRNSLEKEQRMLRPYTSPALDKREEKQNVRLYGSKCRECDFIQYPMRRVCLECGAKDQMEDYKISHRGEIFTYTREYYIPFTPMNPPLAMVIVDMEGGGRLHIQMTDHEFDEVNIGTPVRLTYRKLFEAGDVANYFWKCTPVREGGG